MNASRAIRWFRIGYAAATGAAIGSLFFWTVYWFTFVRGNLEGPDFFSFYAAARLLVARGGGTVYNLALQKQFQDQVTAQWPGHFILLPYIHPPYYTVLIAPLALLPYRAAYETWGAVNLLLAAAVIALALRASATLKGRAVLVAAPLAAGWPPPPTLQRPPGSASVLPAA